MPQPDEPDAPPQRRRSDDRALPDHRRWAAKVAQAVVEVLAGERPVGQLTHWTTPAVYAQLARRAALVSNRSTAQRSAMRHIVLRRVHVSRPADGVVEVATVIHGRDPNGTERARALAFRLEQDAGRWICTVLELG